MMRLKLDLTDFVPTGKVFMRDYLEKFLEDEFCHWDIDMAFDWDTLWVFKDHIEIGFREFK